MTIYDPVIYAKYTSDTFFGEFKIIVSEFDEYDDLVNDWSDVFAGVNLDDLVVTSIEGFGGSHDVSLLDENPSVEQLFNVGRGLIEHGEAFDVYLQHTFLLELDDNSFEDRYCGQYDYKSDYAREVYEDMKLPSMLAVHIDWDSVMRDLECGDVWSVQGDSGMWYVFYN